LASDTSKTPVPAKKGGLLRSSALVSAMTMISRVLGLVRDAIFAQLIGAGGGADAFFVAFKVPNFLRRLFAEGAFSQAFVPVLSEMRVKGSHEAVLHFINRVAGCLGISLLGVSVLVIAASPLFTFMVGSGFFFNDPEKFWRTSDMLRITFPYLLLVSMTGFAGAILNSYDRFAVPALTPSFLNISLICAALFAAPYFEYPETALAWGVLVAGLIQLTFQVPFLLRIGMLPHPTVDWRDESVRKVLKLMAPAMFGVSVSQINLLFDTLIASHLQTGSVSWLYYSDRLVELPLGVFGVGIATVVLPSLSRINSDGSGRFSLTLDWALKCILLIALPATVALLILAKPILFTIFQYGETRPSDIVMASMSLQAYALGLCAFMLIKVLASAFFSCQDMKTPVRIGIIAMVANMAFNVILVVPLHIYWQVGHVGLAAATAGSAFLNVGLLYRGLRLKGLYQPGAGWSWFLVRSAIAIMFMALCLVALLSTMPDFEALAWLSRVGYTAILVVAGGLAYGVTLVALGLRAGELKSV